MSLADRNANQRSTPHQRLHLRTLLSDAELPLDRVSVMHRPLFEKAGVPWENGANLDGVLSSLSKPDISRLIDAARGLQ